MSIATADLYDERGDELDSLALQLQDLGGAVALRRTRSAPSDARATTPS